MSLPHAVNTRNPAAVASYVEHAFVGMGFSESVFLVEQLFRDTVRMFSGEYPGYRAIDMRYHDFEHTLQATVCAAAILAGRHTASPQSPLSRRDCEMLLAGVLLHDTGYLKRHYDADGTGAKYTLVHVRRSCEFAWDYLPTVGFSRDEISDVTAAISCTGPGNRIDKVSFRRPATKTMAAILVTADYLGQMAAPDYVDELPILFHEFEEAYEFERVPAADRPFKSAGDLIRKTPDFWRKFVLPMLDAELEGVYRFIPALGNGAHPYLAAVEWNIARVRALAAAPDASLDPFLVPERRETLA
jgi:hypothetical protein